MEALAAAVVGVGLAICALSAVSLFKTQNLLREIHKEYSGVINNAMIHLKAQNVQEAVEAKTYEKEADVRVEMLRDAMAQGPAEEVDEPKFVHTDDGRTIDLRDYELV